MPYLKIERGIEALMAVWFLALVFTITLADQFSKVLVSRRLKVGQSVILVPGVRLRPALNPTGYLLPIRSRYWWIILCLLLGMFTIWVIGVASSIGSPMLLVGTAMAVGGAIGNTWDRFRRGAVFDFLDLGFWPLFNLADVAIVAGILVAGLGVIT